jgi:hypothetical protein
MNRVALELVAASSIPATSLLLVEARSPLPDDEARRDLATFSRDVVSRMSLAVVVSEGGGFRGALVRAVGVTLTTIVPHRSHFKFTNDVESAAQLLARHLQPASVGAADLVRAVEEARLKIGEARTVLKT